MKKVLLLILDGWGLAPAWGGNAIEMANTPTIDGLWREYPHLSLQAAQEAVGLPYHEPGNSEVGHLNIGCGRIVEQNLPGITANIKNGSFFTNPVILEAMENALNNNSSLHLLGMVSDGGIHSHNSHLYALLRMAKTIGIKNVYIHMITDGRDTDPMKALQYTNELEDKIKEIGVGKIVTVMGRYFAMDRDKHWDRIKLAYDAIVNSIGSSAKTPQSAISESYRQNHTDEFIIPTIILQENGISTTLNQKDSLIFFNFRADRAKEIIRAIIEDNFSHFKRKPLNNIYFATFSFFEEYSENSKINTVFHLQDENITLSEVISQKGLKQLHLAETEKYAHVTYFFNGGREKPFDNESRILIHSPNVATYDLKPEMSAKELTQNLINSLKDFSFIVCNFANSDMVGHTGNTRAAIICCEVIDSCLKKIMPEAIRHNFNVIVTADHGNAEQMINPSTGEPFTEHTINPVPFILCSEDDNLKKPLIKPKDREPALQDIAPTILAIMEIPKSKTMTGVSLISGS